MSTSRINCVLGFLLLSRDVSVLCYIHGNNQHRATIPGSTESTTIPQPTQDQAQISIGKQHDRLISSRPGSGISSHDDSSVSVAMPLHVHPSSATTTSTLSPLEAWCLTNLDGLYHQSQAMKCPFLRRRYGDILDNVEKIMKLTVIRRQCWSLMGPPQAWRPAGVNKKLQRIKYKGVSLEDLRTLVLNDWKPDTGKGYYVTGKLTTACYRDDCFFLGPDPDMPIRGLRKYVGVAAHLFDTDQSRATLHSLQIVNDTLVAEWELKGIIRLPWHPSLPTLSGTTIYHVDSDGLIERHEEFWNISVAYAFCFTLFPDLAKILWKTTDRKSVV